jgi:hypothetical protein
MWLIWSVAAFLSSIVALRRVAASHDKKNLYTCYTNNRKIDERRRFDRMINAKRATIQSFDPSSVIGTGQRVPEEEGKTRKRQSKKKASENKEAPIMKVSSENSFYDEPRLE